MLCGQCWLHAPRLSPDAVLYVPCFACGAKRFLLLQIVNETIPALQKLKEEGLIKFIGITGYPLDIYTYVLDR